MRAINCLQEKLFQTCVGKHSHNRGTTASSSRRFKTPSQGVSAHYIISSRDGSINPELYATQGLSIAAGNLSYHNVSSTIEPSVYGVNNWTEAQFVLLVAFCEVARTTYDNIGEQSAFPAFHWNYNPQIQRTVLESVAPPSFPEPSNPAVGGGPVITRSHHGMGAYQALCNDTTPPSVGD